MTPDELRELAHILARMDGRLSIELKRGEGYRSPRIYVEPEYPEWFKADHNRAHELIRKALND